MERLNIMSTCVFHNFGPPTPDLYHVKFAPEHDEHSLEAEKLCFKLQNQLFLPKARNSWVPNEVTQVQIS